jgi:hypothetical protein
MIDSDHLPSGLRGARRRRPPPDPMTSAQLTMSLPFMPPAS